MGPYWPRASTQKQRARGVQLAPSSTTCEGIGLASCVAARHFALIDRCPVRESAAARLSSAAKARSRVHAFLFAPLAASASLLAPTRALSLLLLRRLVVLLLSIVRTSAPFLPPRRRPDNRPPYLRPRSCNRGTLTVCDRDRSRLTYVRLRFHTAGGYVSIDLPVCRPGTFADSHPTKANHNEG